MNLGLVLTIVSLCYVILTSIIYFSKQRIGLLENKIYELLLISTMIGFSINIISFILDIYFSNLIFLRILFIKCYYFYILTFLFLMDLYLFISSVNKSNKNKIIKPTISIYIITAIINFFLPLNYQQNDHQIYLSGINVYFIYFLFAMFLMVWIIYILNNLKKINKTKYVPIITYIIFAIPIVIIQAIYPELLLETALIAFVLVFMYHTIENPDLKMINELELAKNNAEKANNAKTEFLSSMSHEIRTPLNAIIGFSECIIEEKEIEKIHEEAKDIIMAGNNLLEIVNGILDISKIEANKMEIVEVDYNPLEIFNDLTKLIIPRIGEKPIELKTNFSKDIPAILYGDKGKIKEIITNLLTNAVKYTEKGLIVFSVSCINDKNISKLVISVEDTGRGIKPEKIDKLFTKFNRLEEDRNTTLEGTGLGLAITKNLVEMMGGKIVVQSKYGSGSKFTVYLKQKIVSINKVTVKEGKIDENLDNQSLEYFNKKILIVDDNKLNIKVATRLLTPYKVEIDTCESGITCLDKIKQGNKYDLILLDDMMPKLSGVETLKELKKEKEFNIPVIALTANAINGMREKYLSDGFNDYLAKPIDKLELRRVLNEYLKKNT